MLVVVGDVNLLQHFTFNQNKALLVYYMLAELKNTLVGYRVYLNIDILGVHIFVRNNK